MWSELGRRLTERWVSALALPGALYLAVATAAYALGWSGAWDVGHLAERITGWAENPRVDTLGGQALVFAAVVAGSTATGLVARGLGWLVERVWTAADQERWPPPLRGWAERWVRSRRRRWDGLRVEVERARRGEREEGEQARRERGEGERTRHGNREEEFATAYDRMARISPERPLRPTWCGDRITAVRTRLDRDHSADLTVLWPHLWLILPEEVRLEVTGAREQLTGATGLAAWALLYLPMTVAWWPAALVAAALAGIAWVRVRTAVGIYATLVEATVRLHVVELADRVGVAHDGTFSRELGERLTLRLRASVPPVPPAPPSPPASASQQVRGNAEHDGSPGVS